MVNLNVHFKSDYNKYFFIKIFTCFIDFDYYFQNIAGILAIEYNIVRKSID